MPSSLDKFLVWSGITWDSGSGSGVQDVSRICCSCCCSACATSITVALCPVLGIRECREGVMGNSSRLDVGLAGVVGRGATNGGGVVLLMAGKGPWDVADAELPSSVSRD